MVSTKILSCKLFFYLVEARNVSWTPNQHIKIIYEGSYDWSNGCWKFSLVIKGINYIWKYIVTESIIIEIREHKIHFSKTLLNLTDPKLLQFADFWSIWCSCSMSLYYQCRKYLCCLIFLWKLWYYFQNSLMNRKFKRTAFIWNRINLYL